MPHTAATAAPPAAFARPELLAPAGDWDCVRAAVENGADAIYFGLERFNARMRAQNFTAATLPKVMEFLHARGVKGYITFNILVFANELAEAEEFLRAIDPTVLPGGFERGGRGPSAGLEPDGCAVSSRR